MTLRIISGNYIQVADAIGLHRNNYKAQTKQEYLGSIIELQNLHYFSEHTTVPTIQYRLTELSSYRDDYYFSHSEGDFDGSIFPAAFLAAIKDKATFNSIQLTYVNDQGELCGFTLICSEGKSGLQVEAAALIRNIDKSPEERKVTFIANNAHFDKTFTKGRLSSNRYLLDELSIVLNSKTLEEQLVKFIQPEGINKEAFTAFQKRLQPNQNIDDRDVKIDLLLRIQLTTGFIQSRNKDTLEKICLFKEFFQSAATDFNLLQEISVSQLASLLDEFKQLAGNDHEAHSYFNTLFSQLRNAFFTKQIKLTEAQRELTEEKSKFRNTEQEVSLTLLNQTLRGFFSWGGVAVGVLLVGASITSPFLIPALAYVAAITVGSFILGSTLLFASSKAVNKHFELRAYVDRVAALDEGQESVFAEKVNAINTQYDSVLNEVIRTLTPISSPSYTVTPEQSLSAYYSFLAAPRRVQPSAPPYNPEAIKLGENRNTIFGAGDKYEFEVEPANRLGYR
ncbi:Uncharacterised protein (plasmid) [Legionella adelaidensis]|uniref:Dot/Icm secretion system substrate n=1 Tax=Legionella adelaidensis TaxID=45056 RepID=A0A0W0R0E7_9GAMM|nr:hypothetical protein [Legionella adelaidensis]KTC64550.1 hypothetical protein Lade_1844 [Legionella adelaidensis]VEH85918.1 Uncharacterised protein [Legionella adelaidensis]